VKKSKRWISFLKTTAVGGLLFLLPLIVLGALVSQVAPIIYNVVVWLNGHAPLRTPRGIAFLILLAFTVLLLLGFAAGLIAKWSIGKRASGLFEKNLLLLFPRYAVLKDQMADSIGGAQNKPQMKAVLVHLDDQRRVGFETERSADGARVAVYLPGSPDTWAGVVAILDADRVESLPATFGEAVSSCEQLGRGTFALIQRRFVPEEPVQSAATSHWPQP
jgi:uncharacterized membrane protein